MAACPVRVRAWSHRSDGNFDCRLPAGHDGEHVATGLFPDQAIHWQPGDRRCFTGECVACGHSVCILPAGHHGNHANEGVA